MSEKLGWPYFGTVENNSTSPDYDDDTNSMRCQPACEDSQDSAMEDAFTTTFSSVDENDINDSFVLENALDDISEHVGDVIQNITSEDEDSEDDISTDEETFLNLNTDEDFSDNDNAGDSDGGKFSGEKFPTKNKENPVKFDDEEDSSQSGDDPQDTSSDEDEPLFIIKAQHLDSDDDETCEPECGETGNYSIDESFNKAGCSSGVEVKSAGPKKQIRNIAGKRRRSKATRMNFAVFICGKRKPRVSQGMIKKIWYEMRSRVNRHSAP